MKNIIATTLIAITALTAVPAKAADSSDVVAGLIFGLILGQHAERNQQQQQQPVYRNDAPVVVMPQHNPRNTRGQVGYTRGYDNPDLVCYQEVVRTRNFVEVISTNCYGEILTVTRTPRY
jgi:hypothetical protein|tara:strand:+ start:98 stop:457 length:360 start_codon:yes stop_codon:yes gene_type:complete